MRGGPKEGAAGGERQGVLIKGARVLDPSLGLDALLDLWIKDGLIQGLDRGIKTPGALTIEAEGKVLVPGLIDVHVHLRDLQEAHKETIATGTRAAAKGGFTTVVSEPNTSPPLDSAENIDRWRRLARRDAVVNLYSKACITRGRRGQDLVSFSALARRRPFVVAATDDGNPVYDDRVMERAMKAARRWGILLASHCEDGPGGPFRGGRPYWSEPLYIERDLWLAERLEVPLHICHVSMAESLYLIRRAKARGVRVTCEVTPHHLLLSEEEASRIGPDAKVNPPLRRRRDVEALQEALAEGLIDVIASDHAPHHPDEKARGWQEAPFGVIGLETTWGVLYTHLVSKGVLDLGGLIERLSANPAKAFGLPGGSLLKGQRADITILDLEEEWEVLPEEFASKGRNTPFKGWRLRGRAWGTIVQGRPVMIGGRLLL